MSRRCCLLAILVLPVPTDKWMKNKRNFRFIMHACYHSEKKLFFPCFVCFVLVLLLYYNSTFLYTHCVTVYGKLPNRMENSSTNGEKQHFIFCSGKDEEKMQFGKKLKRNSGMLGGNFIYFFILNADVCSRHYTEMQEPM